MADPHASLAEISSEIDARVCSLHRLAEALRLRVEGTRQDGGVVDLARIEERANYIAVMRHLHAELSKLSALVTKNGIAADSLHRAEIRAAQDGLSRAQTRASDAAPASTSARALALPLPQSPPQSQSPQPSPQSPQPQPQPQPSPQSPPSEPWGMAASDNAAKKVPWATLAASAGVPRSLPGGGATPVRKPVKVSGEIYVDATVLPSALQGARDIYASISPGELYYIPHWNHFAVRVGPCVFHANIGRVYIGAPPRSAGPVPRETPERVKECRRAKCQGGASCRYYHDPEEYPGSTDVRNFMSDSWLYSPAASPARYGTRRIGSAEYLEADLRVVGAEEARRFIGQTAHDILCSIILWNHVLAPRGGKTQKQRDGPHRR